MALSTNKPFTGFFIFQSKYMAQKLYTVKVFFTNPNKHPSVWHNCNQSGLHKLKIFADKKGIAYVQAFKPHTENVAPLFTIYMQDVYSVSIFFKGNNPAIKIYSIINLQAVINDAKRCNAAGINIYNLKEKRFIETIKF